MRRIWLAWAVVCGWVWAAIYARAIFLGSALEPEAGEAFEAAEVWQERARRAERRSLGLEAGR